MLKTLRQIWRRIASTRHPRALESEIARQGAENDQQRATITSQQNEIARLRAENRALLNSILGIAGIPPILLDAPPPDFAALPSSVSLPTKCHSESAAADDESRSTPSHPSSTAAEKNSPGAQRPRNDILPHSSSLQSSSSPPRRHLATPLRRRSWHQIMRTLEFESGKKKAATD